MPALENTCDTVEPLTKKFVSPAPSDSNVASVESGPRSSPTRPGATRASNYYDDSGSDNNEFFSKPKSRISPQASGRGRGTCLWRGTGVFGPTNNRGHSSRGMRTLTHGPVRAGGNQGGRGGGSPHEKEGGSPSGRGGISPSGRGGRSPFGRGDGSPGGRGRGSPSGRGRASPRGRGDKGVGLGEILATIHNPIWKREILLILNGGMCFFCKI